MVADELTMYVREYIDPVQWNALVKGHPRNHLLQSWGWGNLKGAFGWQPLRIAVQAADGRVAAAQVLFRQMLGVSVAYVPRGPLFSGDAALDKVLLQALRRIAHQRRAAFLRLEPNILTTNTEANTIHSFLQVHNFRTAEPLQPHTSIHLDLAPSADKLLTNATKGHRADVRRAERYGVQIRVSATNDDLDAFYRIMQATAMRAQFGIHSAAYYQRAFAALREPWYRDERGDGAAHLLLAEHEGAVVAAFMIFGWGSEGQYMYSGSTDAGLRSGANHLLQWHAIQWMRERGCARYDLWGVPEVIGELAMAGETERPALEAAAKDHPLYGAYRFKKGWGGDVVRYLPAYDQVYMLPAYWLWKRRGGA